MIEGFMSYIDFQVENHEPDRIVDLSIFMIALPDSLIDMLKDHLLVFYVEFLIFNLFVLNQKLFELLFG